MQLTCCVSSRNFSKEPAWWRVLVEDCNVGASRCYIICCIAERHCFHSSEPREPTMPDSIVQTSQEADLAKLMVKTLNLELTADTIDPLAPLFRDGLGLDFDRHS